MVMSVDDEGGPSNVLSMVNMAMSVSDDHKRFFKFCYMIFNACEKASWCAEAENILRDVVFMQKVGFLSAVKESGDKVYYYGVDKGFKDPLAFLPDVETEIVDVEIRFLRYLGVIIKELQEGDELEF